MLRVLWAVYAVRFVGISPGPGLLVVDGVDVPGAAYVVEAQARKDSVAREHVEVVVGPARFGRPPAAGGAPGPGRMNHGAVGQRASHLYGVAPPQLDLCGDRRAQRPVPGPLPLAPSI